MSEEQATYGDRAQVGSRVIDAARLDELEALERAVKFALSIEDAGEPVSLVEQLNASFCFSIDLIDGITDAIEPVRSWYDGDGEITDDAAIVKAIVEDLQADRAQAHMIQEILGCTGQEVIQTIKSLKETARIGGDARIAISRLRADVQHSVNVGQPLTIEAVLARLDAICEPTKATA